MKSILSGLYQIAVNARNFLYDSGLLDSLQVGVPVISVGNLSMGGTGKTPLTQVILQYYLERQIQPAVVSRNYKATAQGIHRVDPLWPKAASLFGDEPTLLAQNNPQVGVFVGRCKWQTALAAAKAAKPQVIVVDDGFQHRALHRDLDIVLIDISASLKNSQVIPQGQNRESTASLRRADLIVLSKINFASDENKIYWQGILPESIPVLQASYHLPAQGLGEKAVAFAGLADPLSFQRSLAADTMYEICEFVCFADHHIFTPQDVEQLLQKMKQHGADVLVMTEKDEIKIRPLVAENSEAQMALRPLPLQIKLTGAVEEFHGFLDKVIHSMS